MTDFFVKPTPPSKTAKRTSAEELATLAGHEDIHPLTEEVVLDGEAQQARRSAAIASWWRPREIEQAGIRLDVTHCKVIRDGAEKKARLRLPTSKTEPTGIGAGGAYLACATAYWTG